MYLSSFKVRNFRRLVDVSVKLDEATTVFVGANNSGKTSATQIFQQFLIDTSQGFSIFDFSADCWDHFNIAIATGDLSLLPEIQLDLWFNVDNPNIHRVAELLPSLDWDGQPIGVRLSHQVRNPEKLLANYSESKEKAAALSAKATSDYKPWPVDVVDYLKKRLSVEFETRYYTLASDADGTESVVHSLGNASAGARQLLDSIIQVDFMDAQRNLTDGEARGRYESLSKRLSQYYRRNLDKRDADVEALSAIAESESRLNEHFVATFEPILGNLSKLGYPGLGNYALTVKAEFNASSILSSNTNVHYELPSLNGEPEPRHSLPDRYNGLGFKNLIYMAVELLDFHENWVETDGDRPPVHLILIEEPESHLHAQLQQVFIRQLMGLLPSDDAGFQTQFAVTTHSPHIIYENEFRAIRYFRRIPSLNEVRRSEVLDLSNFYDAEHHEVREFLRRYLKLTHCDLFFADACVLVEGNVERLLVPLMISKDFPGLQASHLTILEIGGAYAHRFRNLVAFLGIPTLVITDLDSVQPKSSPRSDSSQRSAENLDADDEPVGSIPGEKCLASTPGAITSNETLARWLPGKRSVAELVSCKAEEKELRDDQGVPLLVRVAYQYEVQGTWNGEARNAAGRTLEEAFALENLDWCQHDDRAHLGLRIPRSSTLDFSSIHQKIYDRVNRFDKTAFAMGLITEDRDAWTTPRYIAEGLTWLERVTTPTRPVLPSRPIQNGTS